MLNISLRKEFVKRHTNNCRTEELYHHYNYYYFKHSKKDSPVEKFGDCLWYIKELLNRVNPEECIKLICSIEKIPFNSQNVEIDYCFILNTIAKIHLFHSNYVSAVHWAKKALDMVDYFYPYLNNESKELKIQENSYYQECAKIFEVYKLYFYEELHKEIILKWEEKFYYPTEHANQNFKYRLNF